MPQRDRLHIIPHSYGAARHPRDARECEWPAWKMAVSYFFVWFIWVTIVLSWLTAITAMAWWLASRVV